MQNFNNNNAEFMQRIQVDEAFYRPWSSPNIILINSHIQ